MPTAAKCHPDSPCNLPNCIPELLTQLLHTISRGATPLFEKCSGRGFLFLFGYSARLAVEKSMSCIQNESS
jgi:hypothetical protein